MRRLTAGSTRQIEATDDFPKWVQEHQEALRQYCRSLAGSMWEGDDLAQDTWVKIWSYTARSKGQIQLTRAYLYRTARNTWIDYRRKKILPVHPTILEEIPHQKIDDIMLWTAMETIVGQLSSRQRIAILLVDIMQYTAAEAAELLQSTEGAIKAALHRGRGKLRTVTEKKMEDQEESSISESLVYAYLEAFRRQDATALAMLFNDIHSQDIVPALTMQSYRQHSQRKPEFSKSKLVRSHLMTLSCVA